MGFTNDCEHYFFVYVLGIVEGKMDDVLGCFSVPLDGRFAAIRSSESNLGNWVSNLLKFLLKLVGVAF